MNKLFFLVGCIAISLTSYAQSNFKPGFIITNENDTVYGWIDYRTDKMNAEACLFREEERGTSQTYYPKSIQAYRFTEEGKFYVSKEIKFNDSKRIVFLEFMLQGMINLYRYDFGDDVCYFFETDEGELIPVSRRQGNFVDEDWKMYQRNDMRYKNVLWYVFKDTEPIAKEAKKTRFDNKSMMHLAKLYHDEVCTTGEECIIFEEKPDKNFTKFRFSVYGGFRFNNYILSKKRELPSMENNFGMSPTIGVQLNISVPRRMKSLSLQGDISLSSFNKTSDYKEYTDVYKYKYKYESTMLVAKLGAKYTFPRGQWRPTIEGSFAYMNTFNRKVSIGDKQSLSNPSEYYASKVPFGYMFGMDIGVGLDYCFEKENAVFFRLSYEYFPWSADGYLKNISYRDKLHGIVLKAGYTF